MKNTRPKTIKLGSDGKEVLSQGRDLFTENMERKNRNWNYFQNVFCPRVHRSINAYWHPITGFDVVQFDHDWFKSIGGETDEEFCLADSLLKRIGQSAVDCVLDMIGGDDK